MRKACMRREESLTPADVEVDSSVQQRSFPETSRAEFQHQFKFVSGLDVKAERKKTRSWVTTQHYRKKRYEAKKAGDEANLGANGKGPRRSTSPVRSSKTNGGRPRGEGDEDRTSPEHAVTGASFLQRLGGGRADPFNSYPVVATHDVHQLVDHYYFVIPSLVHRYWQRAARRPRACWDLFNLYRMHEIPFLGMLHHAAHHLAGMKGQHESLQIIEFKQRSLVAVNQSLQQRDRSLDDWTIIGVGLLANAERVWGDREIAKMHWAALKRLLVERGGFPSLQHNPAMHTKLVWSFVALSWPTADGNPAYVDGFTETAVETPGCLARDPQGAFRGSCSEFVHFFHARRSQVLKKLPSTFAQQRELENHPYRMTMFAEGSDLGNGLEAIATGYSSPDKRRAVDNCRMACLIHLNLIMADYGDFSPATEDFLHTLQRILDQDDDDSSLSAEHLLWTLLAAFPPKEHYERIWKMSRLVGVVKRTRAHTWIAIENALRMFLRWPGSVVDLEAVVSGWNREEFLREAQRTDDEVDG